MPTTGRALDLLKQLFVIGVVIDGVYLRCVNDQQWPIIVGMEKPRVRIRQLFKVSPFDVPIVTRIPTHQTPLQ